MQSSQGSTIFAQPPSDEESQPVGPCERDPRCNSHPLELRRRGALFDHRTAKSAASCILQSSQISLADATTLLLSTLHHRNTTQLLSWYKTSDHSQLTVSRRLDTDTGGLGNVLRLSDRVWPVKKTFYSANRARTASPSTRYSHLSPSRMHRDQFPAHPLACSAPGWIPAG